MSRGAGWAGNGLLSLGKRGRRARGDIIEREKDERERKEKEKCDGVVRAPDLSGLGRSARDSSQSLDSVVI
jgi:hypothetical protein